MIEPLAQKNNFNILRLLAAVFVIYCHSFGFYHLLDPIYIFTNGNIPGGQLAVFIFFVLIGYLITASWLRTENIKMYLENRVRRIFPGLITIIILAILIVGPLFTNLSLAEYFSSPETYRYIWNLSLWKMSLYLPGVFVFDGNEHIVNAPLWTLFFEFVMYLLLVVFGLFKIFNKKKRFIYILWMFFGVALLLATLGIPHDLFVLKINAKSFIRFFVFFFAGALYLVYHYCPTKIRSFIDQSQS